VGPDGALMELYKLPWPIILGSLSSRFYLRLISNFNIRVYRTKILLVWRSSSNELQCAIDCDSNGNTSKYSFQRRNNQFERYNWKLVGMLEKNLIPDAKYPKLSSANPSYAYLMFHWRRKLFTDSLHFKRWQHNFTCTNKLVLKELLYGPKYDIFEGTKLVHF